ncbi:mucin-3B-like [Spea bombifrons]|uniref:mucin-3B-like n=1 Tax=Spea bombifrons TaxID=233779 RepID=UPI002349A50D|nr:mucin-3B-like [Spea bombifrons]
MKVMEVSHLIGVIVLALIPGIQTTTTRPVTTSHSMPQNFQCLNGGLYDGIKCICSDDYFGTICESAIDKVVIGKSINTTVVLEIRITNREYTGDLSDVTSDGYKQFEEVFKAEMKYVYGDIPGYRDVIINSLRAGSVIVDHDVIVEMEFHSYVSVNEMYEEIFQRVQTEFEEFIGSNCTPGDSPLCISSVTIAKHPPPTPQELCDDRLPPGIKEFYTPVIRPEGLVCVSDCSQESEKYVNCNVGQCALQPQTGPECFCPNTDIYMYTSPRCRGRVLKAALYGGVGAAAGLLVTAIAIMVIMLYRSKRQRPQRLYEEPKY